MSTKKKSKALKELEIYETKNFATMTESIFTGPVIRSLATSHIKKAILNVGVVLEMARTRHQAVACLRAANALKELCDVMNERL